MLQKKEICDFAQANKSKSQQEIAAPKSGDARAALNTLTRYFESHPSATVEGIRDLMKLNSMFEKLSLVAMKQTTIDDFFQTTINFQTVIKKLSNTVMKRFTRKNRVNMYNST